MFPVLKPPAPAQSNLVVVVAVLFNREKYNEGSVQTLFDNYNNMMQGIVSYYL